MYNDKRGKLKEEQSKLIGQINYKQNELTGLQKELQGLVDGYNKVMAKLELLDELEKEQK